MRLFVYILQVPHQRASRKTNDIETLLIMFRDTSNNSGMSGSGVNGSGVNGSGVNGSGSGSNMNRGSGNTGGTNNTTNDAMENDGLLSQKHILEHFRTSPSSSPSSMSNDGGFGNEAMASMVGTSHAALASETLHHCFDTLVSKVQMVVRQPSERISASFRPTVNVPVFSFVGVRTSNQEVSSSTNSSSGVAKEGMSVPNCMLALHVRKSTATEKIQNQRLVAFAGREGDAETEVNCVWVMRKDVITHAPNNQTNTNASSDDDENNENYNDEKNDNDNEGLRQRSRKRGRGEEEDDNNEGRFGTEETQNKAWSICCIPLPIGHSVVALDFYGTEDEEWLVALVRFEKNVLFFFKF